MIERGLRESSREIEDCIAAIENIAMDDYDINVSGLCDNGLFLLNSKLFLGVVGCHKDDWDILKKIVEKCATRAGISFEFSEKQHEAGLGYYDGALSESKKIKESKDLANLIAEVKDFRDDIAYYDDNHDCVNMADDLNAWLRSTDKQGIDEETVDWLWDIIESYNDTDAHGAAMDLKSVANDLTNALSFRKGREW